MRPVDPVEGPSQPAMARTLKYAMHSNTNAANHVARTHVLVLQYVPQLKPQIQVSLHACMSHDMHT